MSENTRDMLAKMMDSTKEFARVYTEGSWEELQEWARENGELPEDFDPEVDEPYNLLMWAEGAVEIQTMVDPEGVRPPHVKVTLTTGGPGIYLIRDFDSARLEGHWGSDKIVDYGWMYDSLLNAIAENLEVC